MAMSIQQIKEIPSEATKFQIKSPISPDEGNSIFNQTKFNLKEPIMEDLSLDDASKSNLIR
jgi:hypothetical protein